MKVYSLLTLLILAALPTGVLADAANKLVSFASADDHYADGSGVVDREWYALVWSADGVFEGLKLDTSPIDANDEVALLAPLAKDGGCPYTVFQVDSRVAKAGGQYEVYLLDTRNADKTAAAPANAEGRPTAVNGAVKAVHAQIGGEWTASKVELPAEVEPATIADIRLSGGKAVISVKNLLPGVKYNLLSGRVLGQLDHYVAEVPKTAADSADFIVDTEDAGYFQLVREPLAR